MYVFIYDAYACASTLPDRVKLNKINFVMKNKFGKCATEYLCCVPPQLPSVGILSVHRDRLVKTWTEHRTGHTGKKLQGPLQSNDHFFCFPGYSN